MEQENQNYVILSCSLFSQSSLDKWSAYEIAVFEAAMSVFGKHFDKISKIVRLLGAIHCRSKRKPQRKYSPSTLSGIFQVITVCGRISRTDPFLFVG